MKRNTNLGLRLIFGCMLAIGFTVAAHSQITGGLRGSVSDPTGAAVPKANVTLTSLDTKATRTQAVNASGEFTFELLSPGPYEVKAEAAGFASSVTQAQVSTGQYADVMFKLEVGQVTQTVEVSTGATLVDTQNAQLQTTVTGQAVQEIPVGRNPNLFALTAPGVAPVTQNNPFLGSGSFNSNGGRGRGNNITVDGITATDVSVTGTGGPLGPLNFSSIKEVQVITNNFDAQYGRNASSQVLYITKGGTNDLHGEAYEYLYNDKLNARGFFDTSGHPNIVRTNTYGFETGGPVYIPKVFDGRNKYFWHVDYEGYKNRGVGTPRIAPVPTPAMLAQITDPTSAALAKQYQIPTSPTGTLAESAPSLTNTWEVAVRGDVVISSKDTLWSRYSVYNSLANSSGNTFINSNLPFFGAASANHPREASLAETHVFGTSAVNEFRFGFGQSKPSFPIQTPYPLGPQISFTDGSVTGLGVSNILPQGREQRTYQYTDNFTISRGAHIVKMGFEWYHLEADSFFDSNVRGSFVFPTWAAFTTGQPSSWTQNFGNSVRQNRVENQFFFIQDDWKATRRLTVNLGFRGEHAGGPTELNGLISNLNLNDHSAFGAAGAGPLGLMQTGKPSFNSNFNPAPRFGFAYKVTDDGKTVIRGGYGIAYDFIFLNPITNQRFLPPLIYSGSLNGNANFTGGNSFANLVAGTADLQKTLIGSVGQLNPTFKDFGSISPAIDQNLDNPQVQQWNLGVERELPGNLVMKLSYVGTKGTYLSRTRPINLISAAATPAPATSFADEQARLSQFQAAVAGLSGNTSISFSNRFDPRYNNVNLDESSSNSSYNALQLEAQKRFSRNYWVHVSYAWAHSIDDVSDPLGVLLGDTPAQQNPNDNRNNRASSQFDLRHILSISHTWEMPFFRGSTNRFLRGGLGGWSFSGISTFHTGYPVNVYAGGALGNLSDPLQYLGNVTTAITRPNAAGPITGYNPQPAGSAGTPTGTSVVNGVGVSTYAQSLGFSQPLIGNFGTFGRNILRLNSQTNFDWNLYKNFHFSERVNLQVRSEFYNIFNLHAFQQVAGANNGPSITAPNFGQYTAVSLNSRQIQVGARIVW